MTTTDMQTEMQRIASELRAYNPVADEYKGEHIHKVWAKEIEALADSAQDVARAPEGLRERCIELLELSEMGEHPQNQIRSLAETYDARISFSDRRHMAISQTHHEAMEFVAAAPAAPAVAPAQAESSYCDIHCKTMCQNSVHGFCQGAPAQAEQQAFDHHEVDHGTHVELVPHYAEQQVDGLRAAVRAVVDMLKNGEYAEYWAHFNAKGDSDAAALENAITDLVNKARDDQDDQDEQQGDGGAEE